MRCCFVMLGITLWVSTLGQSIAIRNGTGFEPGDLHSSGSFYTDLSFQYGLGPLVFKTGFLRETYGTPSAQFTLNFPEGTNHLDYLSAGVMFKPMRSRQVRPLIGFNFGYSPNFNSLFVSGGKPISNLKISTNRGAVFGGFTANISNQLSLELLTGYSQIVSRDQMGMITGLYGEYISFSTGLIWKLSESPIALNTTKIEKADNPFLVHVFYTNNFLQKRHGLAAGMDVMILRELKSKSSIGLGLKTKGLRRGLVLNDTVVITDESAPVEARMYYGREVSIGQRVYSSFHGYLGLGLGDGNGRGSRWGDQGFPNQSDPKREVSVGGRLVVFVKLSNHISLSLFEELGINRMFVVNEVVISRGRGLGLSLAF